MNVLIFGPQGSGKSTHAKHLASQFKLHHLDIGQLIRSQVTGGDTRSQLIDHLANKKGRLLPDGIVLGILIDQLEKIGYKNLVLDGFPRTLPQLFALEDLLSLHQETIDAAIYLHLPDKEAVDRVIARSRPDDEPQAIASRLEIFHKTVDPILESLKARRLVLEVDTTKPPESVSHLIETFLLAINHNLPSHRQIHQVQSASISFSPQHTSQTPKESNFRTLYVLTHSESDYNRRGIFTGRLDVGLTDVGDHKAQLAAEILKYQKIDLAYRTSLKRTGQTLDYILQNHPETKVIVDDRLIERDYGELSGQSKAEFKRDHPDLFPAYHRSYDIAPPGGESMKTVEERVLAALEEILATIRRDHVNVLIVAHSNSIRPIRRYFEHLTPEEMMKLEHLRHQIFTYKIPV